MEKAIHEKLIDALCFNTPKEKNPVDILISIIPLSKEAAYRRLRGEIRFTLEEAIRISSHFNVSLDEIAGLDKNNQHLFNIRHLFNDDSFERYYELLEDFLHVYTSMKNTPGSFLYYAGNAPTTASYFRFKLITRFVIFKYCYQTLHLHGSSKKMRDVVIPPKITAIQQKICALSAHVNTCVILGSEMVSTLMSDVRYFASIDLLTADEVDALKKEILFSLDVMEAFTRNPVYPDTGKELKVYVAHTYIDGSYSYIKGLDLDIANIGLYGINQLNSIDPVICKMQKEWISTLIQDSTLISGSGKLHAIDFFRQQRAYVYDA